MKSKYLFSGFATLTLLLSVAASPVHAVPDWLQDYAGDRAQDTWEFLRRQPERIRESVRSYAANAGRELPFTLFEQVYGDSTLKPEDPAKQYIVVGVSNEGKLITQGNEEISLSCLPPDTPNLKSGLLALRNFLGEDQWTVFQLPNGTLFLQVNDNQQPAPLVGYLAFSYAFFGGIKAENGQLAPSRDRADLLRESLSVVTDPNKCDPRAIAAVSAVKEAVYY